MRQLPVVLLLLLGVLLVAGEEDERRKKPGRPGKPGKPEKPGTSGGRPVKPGKPGPAPKGFCLSKDEVSSLCLENTDFGLNLASAKETCEAEERRRPGKPGKPGRPAKPSKPLKCRTVEQAREKLEKGFEDQSCILEELGLRTNFTSPFDLQAFDAVTSTLEGSISAAIHPNSTAMRKCTDKLTTSLIKGFNKCWNEYSEEEQQEIITMLVGGAMAECFRFTLGEACGAWLGVKLGRVEVEMRDMNEEDMRELLEEDVRELEEEESDTEEEEEEVRAVGNTWIDYLDAEEKGIELEPQPENKF